eukprot:7200298-Pyramimonas_sp.AAC.1
MDDADYNIKEVMQLGWRMGQLEYEATKDGSKYHEACAQYVFLCKEFDNIKGENSAMAANVRKFDKIAVHVQREVNKMHAKYSAVTDHVQLIDRMNKNTQKQYQNHFELLEQRMKEQDQRIKQLEKM